MDHRRPFSFSDANQSGPLMAQAFSVPDGIPAAMREALDRIERAEKPPTGPQWVHEIKWDGYRVSICVADGAVTIRTRNGQDWTARFPPVARVAFAQTRDAELTMLTHDGRTVLADGDD